MQLENELRLAGIRSSVQEYIFLRLMGEIGTIVVGTAVALTRLQDMKLQLLSVIFYTFLLQFYFRDII